jgi:hypothetical protein
MDGLPEGFSLRFVQKNKVWSRKTGPPSPEKWSKNAPFSPFFTLLGHPSMAKTDTRANRNRKNTLFPHFSPLFTGISQCKPGQATFPLDSGPEFPGFLQIPLLQPGSRRAPGSPRWPPAGLLLASRIPGFLQIPHFSQEFPDSRPVPLLPPVSDPRILQDSRFL